MTKKDRLPHRTVAIGSNPERNRSHNRRVVLEVIRTHGPAGRTRIAKMTQISAQAVANIVDELVAENLVVELGRLRSGRGQPPIQFALNPDGPMTAGIEIAADHLVTVLLDITGTVRASSVIPVADARPDAVLPLILSEIGEARAALATASGMLGVGVVMPGPFEIEGMSSVGPTTLPGWGGVDAVALLRNALGHPVHIENDATAAALGERVFGAGRSLSDFAYIYFGGGLGLGLIQHGRRYRGAFGNAGEIGHVVVRPGGRPCACGQHGCLERYASLQALREKLHRAGVSETGTADIAALHLAGHPVIDEWIGEAAAHLAAVIAMLENLLDPETVILGGALPDGVIDAIIARLDPLPVSVASRPTRSLPRVQRGHTGQLTAALGAAAIPLQETITPRLDTTAAAPEAAPQTG